MTLSSNTWLTYGQKINSSNDFLISMVNVPLQYWRFKKCILTISGMSAYVNLDNLWVIMNFWNLDSKSFVVQQFYTFSLPCYIENSNNALQGYVICTCTFQWYMIYLSSEYVNFDNLGDNYELSIHQLWQ